MMMNFHDYFSHRNEDEIDNIEPSSVGNNSSKNLSQQDIAIPISPDFVVRENRNDRSKKSKSSKALKR